MTAADAERPLIVLDDDPTGAQQVADVPVVVDLDAGSLAQASEGAPRSIHILTNSRAFTPQEAGELVAGAVAVVDEVLPGAPLLMRGDSTLRGHVFEEYLAVKRARYPDRDPVLLLVPALPAAGRVTIDGVHRLREGERLVPLHETEYAQDAELSYSDANLLRWAQERSAGYFAAADGAGTGLEALRGSAGQVVAQELARLSELGRPAVLAPDAENEADIALIAVGARLASARGIPFVVRSSPAYAGILPGTMAAGRAAPPAGVERLLVLCGSHVPTSTRQLARLVDSAPGCLVEADVRALAGDRSELELRRIGDAASALLAAGRLAIVATKRGLIGLTKEEGLRVAEHLARVPNLISPRADVVLAKGGITSAVTLSRGLDAPLARVTGPLLDGVSLWQAQTRSGAELPYVVFPGNVGDDERLLDTVKLLLPGLP